MKRYNLIMIGSLILYAILALFTYQTILHTDNQNKNSYRVEINRILHEVGMNPEHTPSLTSMKYIKRIERLKEGATPTQEELFYTPDNTLDTIIQPVYHEGKRQGYIKLYYRSDNQQLHHILQTVQISLALLEGILLTILFFLKKRLISPFKRLITLSEKMSKGHYQEPVKREKSKYLDSFLWQISQLQDSLADSRKRQLRLEKEKKEMLLSLSHDIKTPLNLITLYAKSLQEPVISSDERQHAAKQIEKKTEEIDSYVQQIMQASREELLDIQVIVEDFYLKDLMEQVLSTYRERCQLRNLQLRVDTYQNRILKGDIHRLQEVMENLFENAFKYGDGLEIHISFDEEDYCQLIRFYNSGTPINEQDWNHIFDSFYRGDHAKNHQGSGLGLYICKEIMHKMGGEIFAEKHEEGTAFVIVLPLT